ncbi:hypothetical protein JW877_09590 [bacterium]|nr:hypothetical protein [bacterium]
MKRTALSLSFLLLAIMVLSCGRGDREDKDNLGVSDQLSFSIDSSLIGEAITDARYGVRFHPPVDWIPLNHELFKQVGEELEGQFGDQAIRVFPLYLLTMQDYGCLLSLTQIRNIETGSAPELAEYESMLNQKFRGEQISKTQFTKGKIKFTQFLIKHQNMVNFKLLFYNQKGDLLQVDYVLPFQVYASEIKSIESSMGSIELLE